MERIFKGPFQPRPFCDSTLNAALPILLEVFALLYRKNMKIWSCRQLYKISLPVYPAQGQIFINARMEPVTSPNFRYKVPNAPGNILLHATTK